MKFLVDAQLAVRLARFLKTSGYDNHKDDYLIFYRPIADGIEVVRIVTGYRDLETLFLDNDLS
ncbi:hypothetical protein [Nostoc sp. UHCC 0252]|uniref:hypothetical protein n=1 Tax=Nostoc sp. UHCC 0252 TaxID=3110241 RepID=UPI002B216C26|nr:hypothetical protein [Nostoc sp. UHCC 0252]MEA5603357.1 hypothetical protein [Nostoc sp. UHCC 0252]